jgi:hypothetical protein
MVCGWMARAQGSPTAMHAAITVTSTATATPLGAFLSRLLWSRPEDGGGGGGCGCCSVVW